jgi:transposase
MRLGPPVRPSAAGSQPKVIAPFVGVVEAWLRSDITLKGSVIHERLAAEHGFTGSYQRVKLFRAEARPRIAAELAEQDENSLRGLHRRFEVVPGAQAQVNWGDEGDLLAHVGISAVFSFHMTLSHSRDPSTCFTTSMDLATFWDCHRRAFAHFGGVPGATVYDRTKTVVKRHVAPGIAVPLHAEAAAFAEHYGFTIDVLAAYRPPRQGPVERQVLINRDHVIAGRSFDSIAELDGAFEAWLPIRRPRSTARTGRSSRSAPRSTGQPCGRCPRCPTWSPTSTCVGWARTAWSPSRPASTPSRPAPSGQDSASSCRSTARLSPSARSAPTAGPGWPLTPAPGNEAPGWSTPPLGRTARRTHPGRVRRIDRPTTADRAPDRR